MMSTMVTLIPTKPIKLQPVIRTNIVIISDTMEHFLNIASPLTQILFQTSKTLRQRHEEHLYNIVWTYRQH